MGLSLAVVGWMFYRGTSAFFNPNVCHKSPDGSRYLTCLQVALGLVLIRAIRPLRFVLFCIAHLVGAILAAALVQALLPGALTVKSVAISHP
jgi:aquaporin rerated protein, other eukaryote